MNEHMRAFKAELIKIKHSKTIWVTFIAFALAPLMGGVFMIILSNPELAAQSTALNAKAQLMSVEANWNSYLSVLSQAVGVGGVMVFGFVISWIFGSEYSDGTAKDLLALPVSRTAIINAKFISYVLWCFALTLSNLLLGFIIAGLLGLEGFESVVLFTHFKLYLITTVLTVLIGTPIAFFALAGRGYLAPLAFLVLTLVFAQIIAAVGLGYYFPWSIPGLYSGMGGDYKSQLNILSYAILLLTSLAGYGLTLLWWKFSDQSK